MEDNKGFVQSDVNGTKASLLIVSLKYCRDGLSKTNFRYDGRG